MQNILNLPGWSVLSTRETDHDYIITAQVAAPPSYCPHCGAVANLQGYGGKQQTYLDLPIQLKAAREALDEAQEQLERAARENERLRQEFQALYASAQTLVQNAGPMFVQLKQAADRAYMAAAHKEI